ncbi:neuraminidase-like domain-containing protein [Pseudomonas sp. S2_A05]
MALSNIGGLLEKRRSALLEYCIGQVANDKYPFLKTPEDLFELLRMDPLDTYQVKSSRVAEAISCVQQYIHAVYRKLEPGFRDHEFDKRHLREWEIFSNYPDWTVPHQISCYAENFIVPSVRLRKTSLFKNLENNLNQARLDKDTVQAALQDYLQAFEQVCDLDVISCFMDGVTPAKADYYFLGRQRVQPFQYFWRKAEIELGATSVSVNPAVWSEWQAVEIPTADQVLDIRPVFWNGRLCVVWAEWRDAVVASAAESLSPSKLVINLAFMKQNGQWSAPLCVHSSEHKDEGLASSRLIATVQVDYLNPKGKLGILLTGNLSSPSGSLRVHGVYDVLMRPLLDGGAWLDLALEERFVSNDTVQHPLNSQVTVVTRIKTHGSLTPYLDLHVMATRADDKDVLTVQGFAAPRAWTALG